MNIKKGKFVSIIGSYGTGKTTLLKMIAGIEPISKGKILIDNHLPDYLKNKKKIGFAFQDSMLFPWNNVMDNLTFPTEINGKINFAKANVLLKLVGLYSKKDSQIHELSGGMQRILAILRATILDPSVLLLDEPFSSIDEINRDDLHEKLIDIHEKNNQTTILVTHSIHEAVYLSDVIYILGENPAKVIKTVIPTTPRKIDKKFSTKTMQEVAYIREMMREVVKNA